jgi:hypothetical protein
LFFHSPSVIISVQAQLLADIFECNSEPLILYLRETYFPNLLLTLPVIDRVIPDENDIEIEYNENGEAIILGPKWFGGENGIDFVNGFMALLRYPQRMSRFMHEHCRKFKERLRVGG